MKVKLQVKLPQHPSIMHYTYRKTQQLYKELMAEQQKMRQLLLETRELIKR